MKPRRPRHLALEAALVRPRHAGPRRSCPLPAATNPPRPPPDCAGAPRRRGRLPRCGCRCRLRRLWPTCGRSAPSSRKPAGFDAPWRRPPRWTNAVSGPMEITVPMIRCPGSSGVSAPRPGAVCLEEFVHGHALERGGEVSFQIFIKTGAKQSRHGHPLLRRQGVGERRLCHRTCACRAQGGPRAAVAARRSLGGRGADGAQRRLPLPHRPQAGRAGR